MHAEKAAPGAHTADQEFLGWLSSWGVEGGRRNQRCAKLLLSCSGPSPLSQSPRSSAQPCLHPTSKRPLALGVSHSRPGSRDPHHSSARDPSPPLQDCSDKDITVASGPSTTPLCGVPAKRGPLSLHPPGPHSCPQHLRLSLSWTPCPFPACPQLFDHHPLRPRGAGSPGRGHEL